MSSAPQFDPNPAPPRKGWFGRNWLWFVPVTLLSTGCLCCLGCGGIFVGVFQALKSSEPYQLAMAHVQNDPQVIAVLGEPVVEAGFVPFGAVEVENDGGTATLYFQVSGPQGQAWVSATAVREVGQWRLTYVEVAPSDGSSSPIVWPADAGQDIPDVDLQFDGVEMPAEESPDTEQPAEPADDTPSESSSDDSSGKTP